MGKKKALTKIKQNFDLYLFVLPGMIITFIFNYIPIYGAQIAFRDFSYTKGFWGSPWVGFDNFIRFFSGAYFWEIIFNTFILAVYSLIAGFPFPIILALLLNSFRHKRYGKIIQTVTYAPNFISTVVMCGMIIMFLSTNAGIVNTLIGFLGIDPINFMAYPSLWRHIYVWTGIWQGTGWGSVIYFAALSGINPEYYEAAIIDGSNKLQRIWYIDIPHLLPTIIFLLIMNCGGILSVGYEKTFLLQNPINGSVSEVISTYVYKMGLVNNDMSFSTAVGLFNSAVNSIMLVTVNQIARKYSEYSIW